MKAPCMSCEKVGCGSYHDECPEYLAYREYKQNEYERREKINKSFGAYIPEKKYRNRGCNTTFKCHKKR